MNGTRSQHAGEPIAADVDLATDPIAEIRPHAIGCESGAEYEGNRGAIEVRQDVHDEYNRKLAAELEPKGWSHPSMKRSWYRNEAGRVTALSPGRLVDYCSWAQRPKGGDCVFSGRLEAEPREGFPLQPLTAG